ncbi:creatinine amidohydrolase [Murinocardiopsis flavida]|uniref:Creatinine amidohydrolase n=1 Tax=Murinocardiopsis flavida TaxID=645275 RepID=A0A2P8D9B9_9ACTN|nr:creatininase family protein [Murinocardiopsis flavida]PSK93803.1 creatinine amidohydrolase [Murinocardiopsis flavida]
MPDLTHMTWREVRDAGRASIALLPIGSQEQHAAHLPMGTDTVLAEAVLDAALERLGGDGPPVVRLPALPYGHSPHHVFAAAVSLSAPTLLAVLADVLDSLARSGFRRIMVVNGHGGNDEAMRLAVKRFALETDVALAACSYWSVTDGGTEGERPDATPGHAGWFETSLMLAARPESVRRPVAAGGPAEAPLFDRPPHPGLTVERHGEWERAGGTTDDASGATAEDGALLLAHRAAGLAAAIRGFDTATRQSHGS